MALGDGIERNKERKSYVFQKGYKTAIDDMTNNLIANSRTEIIDRKPMFIVTEERIKTVANEMKNQLDTFNNVEKIPHNICEWRKSEDYPFDWIIGCDGCEVEHKQGDYCPRCGKKIEVVK